MSDRVSDTDYATWLTKDQAATAIGVTPKSIERFAHAGQIQWTRWQPGGRGPLRVVYQPDDVAKLAAAKRQGPLAPFLMPDPPAAPMNGNGHSSTALAQVPDVDLGVVGSADDLLRALVAAALKVMSQTSQTSAVFVTLPEAAALSGLSQAYLRRKCRDGWTGAIKCGGWRIRRKDLEQL